MSNVNITDWLVFRPAGAVRNARAYIDLPAFSYASQGTAGDASVIVAQYNFSASQDFYLATLPVKPTGVTYGLCIRWRVGETVYRYKLWEDASFNLTDVTRLYARQRVRANFVLEVWNFPGTASVQGSAIRMITSVRTAPTDFRTIADYALAVGAAFTDFASVDPSLPSGATNRWTNFSSSTGCVDVIGGATFVEYGPDVAPITYTAPDASYLRGYASIPDQANILRASAVAGTWNAFTAYLVCGISPLDVTLAKMLLHLTNNDYSTVFVSAKAGATNKARCSGNAGYYDLTIPDIDPHILKISKQASGDVSGRIDELTGNSTTTGLASTSALRIQIGGVTGAPNTYVAGALKLAELLMFNGSFFANGSANDILALQYLRWYHFGEIPLPTSFASGSAWLDNNPL